MPQIIVPENVKKHNYNFDNSEAIPEKLFYKIKNQFQNLVSEQPLISINIIARNEEKNILHTLSSLSEIKSKYPIEVVVVDNDSDDKTAEIVQKCGIEPIHEKQHGYGFARQAALKNSKGKYIITGDSDSIYLPGWVDSMIKPLIEQKAIASFGSYAYIPPENKQRLSFSFYEFLRHTANVFKRINRPELTVGGINFCFPREEALEIGFAKDDHRSEDGRMALALSQKGKLKYVSKKASIAWTDARSLNNSNLLKTIGARLRKEFKRLHLYFYKKNN